LALQAVIPAFRCDFISNWLAITGFSDIRAFEKGRVSPVLPPEKASKFRMQVRYK
jgi:hypothetical protein